MPEEKWQKLSCRSSLAVSRVFRGFEGYTEEPESIGAVRALGGLSRLCCPSVQLNKIWIEGKLLDALFPPTCTVVLLPKPEPEQHKNRCWCNQSRVKIFMFTFRVCISCVLPSWPQIECCSNNLSNFFCFRLSDRESSTASLPPSAPSLVSESCVSTFSPVPFFRRPLTKANNIKRYVFPLVLTALFTFFFTLFGACRIPTLRDQLMLTFCHK